MTDSALKPCILLEASPQWGPRLRVFQRRYPLEFVETRTPSEVDQLIQQQNQRLLLLALQDTMTGKQCVQRIAFAEQIGQKFPASRIVWLVDPEMPSLLEICYEVGGLVFQRGQKFSSIVRMIQQFEQKVRSQIAPTEEQDDSLSWLPW